MTKVTALTHKFITNLAQRSVVALMAATFAVSLLGNLQTASANLMPPISAGPGHRANVSTPRGQIKKNTSNASGSTSATAFYNWSGYAATGSTPYLAVQSTYKQPTVSCPVPGAWTVFWVGFDGYNNGTVEQAGTAAQCSTGSTPTVTYYAWWEMYPTNTIQVMPLTIKPGDTIQATVTYSASTKNYTMTVLDKTSAKSYNKVAACASGLTCARQSAEWIVERPSLNGAYTPLANWSTMSLTNNQAATAMGTFNGVSAPNYQPVSAFTNTPINMVNYPYTGVTLATVNSLNQTGNRFGDSWKAAQ